MRLAVRPMLEGDVAEATRVANAAFAAQVGVAELFTERAVAMRRLANPGGCFVVAGPDEGAPAVGMVLSATRGTLGWFGPLAVDPAAQKAGWGRSLVDACVGTWRAAGVELMGLETIADSAFHVRFYAGMGFRPSWVGLHVQRTLPERVGTSGTGTADVGSPELGFVYPGLDLARELDAARLRGEFLAVVEDDGAALLSARPQTPDPTAGSLTFLAARTREGFDSLMARAEQASASAGFRTLSLRVPGSAVRTLDALVERGYAIGGSMVRMKQGRHLDYDSGDFYYADNWL